MTVCCTMSGPVLFRGVLLALFLTVCAVDSNVLQPSPGEDIVLTCKADAGVSIRAVEWTRDDLEPDSVLYLSDGHSDPTNQNPSFKDRVELVDRELKSGDVSLILRNVSVNDSGTYKCRVADGGPRRSKRANIKREPIKRIELKVKDSGSKNEDTNHNSGSQISTNPKDENQINTNPTIGKGDLVLGPIFGLIFVGSVVAGVLVRKYKRPADKQSEKPAADEAVGDQLI